MCTETVLISVTAALMMTHRSRLKADKTSSSLITCFCIWLLQPCNWSEDCDVRTQYVDTALRFGHVSIIDVITADSWHSALAVSASPALVTETWFQQSQCMVQQRMRKIHPASSCCAHGTIVGRRECSVVGYIQPALAGCAASGLWWKTRFP